MSFPSSHTDALSTMTFIISIVGDIDVGKSAFISRHATGKLLTSHQHTSKPIHINHSFYTSVGKITLVMTEADSNVKPDGEILMFSLGSLNSYSWASIYAGIPRMDSHPRVVVGTKCDIVPYAVNLHSILFPKKHGLEYYEISSLTTYNLNKPLLYLIRCILDDDSIQFTEAPPQAQIPGWTKDIIIDIPEKQDEIPIEDKIIPSIDPEYDEWQSISDQIDSFHEQLESCGLVADGRYDFPNRIFRFTSKLGRKYTIQTILRNKD